MAYSNEELTQRVKQLENIIMDMMSQAARNSSLRGYVRGVCVNTSLHGRPEYAEDHPASLMVPHYAFEPQIDWGWNMINLHPLNRPRCKTCLRISGMPSAPCKDCPDFDAS